MSCYFRHIAEVFAAAGIEVTPANRKDLDRILHEIVAVAYKDCPNAWRALKADLAVAVKRAALIKKLRTRVRRAGLA